VSDPSQPTDEPTPADLEARQRATAALQAAFARLAPQGSDAWNFLAAFTHLGDRYGPYQPGASALSKQLGEAERVGPGSRFRRKRGEAAGSDASELESAMAQVVEAFRFLSARVQTLEERLARQDRPVEGAAWLVPAVELGPLIAPLTGFLVKTATTGEVIHGDCGDGALLRALRDAGLDATGVEPRGTVALGALEQGSRVAMAELHDELAARPDASLGGVVMSGVVDRVPLHALLELLDQAQRTLALGSPLVIVTADHGSEEHWEPRGVDLIDARPLHSQTWDLLLAQAGFVDIAPLATPTPVAGRRVLTASSPT
jgi:hypothetical protein